jgi:P-aminobenzoate N-oxygenase AurF
MQVNPQHLDSSRYARCIEVSKRVRFEIERDVIRGRKLDFAQKFLPDGLSKLGAAASLTEAEKRFASQVQGRTYANMFGLVERFIAPKVLEVSRQHWLGDQTAFEALVRFTDEELKHQEMFRRIERMCAAGMPQGYTFLPQPNDVAAVVLGKRSWAVLAFICDIELFVLAHYREAIEPDPELSPLWKDVFTFHAREESQHALIDELEWKREDAKVTSAERDAAVDDLIALVGAVDGILQGQARADAMYFLSIASRNFTVAAAAAIEQTFLEAYRWQYIVSGVQDARFQKILGAMVNAAQMERIGSALAPIMGQAS